MRISDWSSDVCSSDLLREAQRVFADRLELVAGERAGTDALRKLVEARVLAHLRATRKLRRLRCDLGDPRDALLRHPEFPAAERQPRIEVGHRYEDRKSTRLNSSH